MSGNKEPRVAIVDYGLGNLYSIRHMCSYTGLETEITADPRKILGADTVILPGVGAFGTAMANLTSLGLVPVLKETAARGTPLLGICLGLQLLMTESLEFGRHRGLDIIPGRVVRFDQTIAKVPHVGWNRIRVPATGQRDWRSTLLRGVAPDTFMYFVHSYYVEPDDRQVVLAETTYETTRFSSGIKQGNVTAFQFHPERSGEQGMTVYRNLLAALKDGIQ